MQVPVDLASGPYWWQVAPAVVALLSGLWVVIMTKVLNENTIKELRTIRRWMQGLEERLRLVEQDMAVVNNERILAHRARRRKEEEEEENNDG